MIVPMKKVALIIKGDKKTETLKELRKLGILQIEIHEGSGEKLDKLKAKQAMLENAVFSLRIQFVLYPVLGVLFCYRNAMQAMGQKAVPVLSSCIELGMKLLAAYWLIPKLGFLGVCITEPVTWVLMVLFLAVAYHIFQKKWFASSNASPEC